MRTMETRYLEPQIFSWPNIDEIIGHLRPTKREIYDEHIFSPPADIIENENNYLISLDLPGIKKEDIKIEVLENSIIISGERLNSQKSENGLFQRYEKSYGAFKRSFSLPKATPTEGIEAHHTHGVLEILVPKAPSTQSRKIEVMTKE